MSSTTNSFYFRRRTLGRASTPPVWACYEQIQGDYSDSDSCSEDDEDYTGDHGSRDSEDEEQQTSLHPPRSDESDDIDMDMDDDNSIAGNRKDGDMKKQKDVKGKQRAVDPEPEPPMRQRKKHPHVYTLRPILTIQKSQGFVWNQVRLSNPRLSFYLYVLYDALGPLRTPLYQRQMWVTACTLLQF